MPCMSTSAVSSLIILQSPQYYLRFKLLRKNLQKICNLVPSLCHECLTFRVYPLVYRYWKSTLHSKIIYPWRFLHLGHWVYFLGCIPFNPTQPFQSTIHRFIMWMSCISPNYTVPLMTATVNPIFIKKTRKMSVMISRAS